MIEREAGAKELDGVAGDATGLAPPDRRAGTALAVADPPPSRKVAERADGAIVWRPTLRVPVVSPIMGLGVVFASLLFTALLAVTLGSAPLGWIATITSIVTLLWPWRARIGVDDDALVVAHGPFGLRRRRIPLETITEISTGTAATSWLAGGRGVPARHLLLVNRVADFPIELGSRLHGDEQDVKWIEGRLTRALSLARSRGQPRSPVQLPATREAGDAHTLDARTAARGGPPCPSCGTSVQLDGDLRTCPRCGRAFTAAMAKHGGIGGVYREAPVALVPVDERAPRMGLTMNGPKSGLDLTIGSAWGIDGASRNLAGLDTIALFIAGLGLPIWDQIAGSLPGWAWLIGALSMARLLVNGAANLRSVRARLVIEGDFLIHLRERGLKRVRMGTVALSRVTGVRDDGDCVRVDLDDGTSWEVGKGLRVPRRVRRWVARHLASRLPRPAAEAR